MGGATAPGRESVVEYVVRELSRLGDAQRAREMAAYLKTDQPMLGISEPDRRPVMKEMVRLFAPAGGSEYRANVCALWEAGRPPEGFREVQYAALWYAQSFDEHLIPAQFPLLRRLIAEGAWWDLVDTVAMQMVSPIVLAHRAKSMVFMRRWIEDEDMWVRRAAILCQIGHKEAADEKVLFEFCLARADEQDFFIRKAIGWALRQHARINSDGVRQFLAANIDRLSPLSVREAGKHIGIEPKAPPAKTKPAAKPRRTKTAG